MVGLVDLVDKEASDVELRFNFFGDISDAEAALDAVRDSAFEWQGDAG